MTLADQSKAAVVFLRNLAETLDGWATESRSGGWSTHQVDANRRNAGYCRQHADALERAAEALVKE